MLNGQFGSHSLLAFFLLFAFIWIMLFTVEPEFVKVDGIISKMLCAWYSFAIAIVVALLVWVVSFGVAYMRTRKELGLAKDLFGFTSDVLANAQYAPAPMMPVALGGTASVAATKQSWSDWFSNLLRGTQVPESVRDVAKTASARIHEMEGQPGMSASARQKLHALEAKIDAVTSSRSSPDSARAEAASKFKRYLEQAQREQTASGRTSEL